MILRKTHAFFIKNFKLIHLMLTTLLGFVLLDKTYTYVSKEA